MDPTRLRFVDISMPLENGVRSDPDIARPHIDYLKHDETVPRIQTFFPDLKAEELPDAAGWSRRVTSDLICLLCAAASLRTSS